MHMCKSGVDLKLMAKQLLYSYCENVGFLNNDGLFFEEVKEETNVKNI